MSGSTTLATDKLACLIGVPSAPILVYVRDDDDYAELHFHVPGSIRKSNKDLEPWIRVYKADKQTDKNSMTIAINRKVYDDFFRYDSAKLRLIGKPAPGLNPQPKLGPWIIDLRRTVKVAEAMQECFDIQDTYGN
ncbi:MAG: hypothetical protein IPM06_06745 [Rhizobiales bacterium]|nr:hypothetical protein [Hyphomicrobiales bacterium]